MPSARVLRRIAGALSEPLDVDAEKLWVELGELLAETRSADAEDTSIRAYILVDATATLPLEEEIASIPWVVSVTQVQGPHDLIVLAESRTLRLMSKVVDRIHKAKGVTRTTTCISLPE